MMKASGEHNHIKGFTLAELLVTVSIIGVLVAVSIPIFTSQLEKARAATCMANRRSLKAALASDYMNGTSDHAYEIDKKYYVDNNEAYAQYICPDDGTITYKLTKEGAFEVSCSVHDGVTFTAESMSKIIEVLRSAATYDKGAFLNHVIDSTAPDGNNYTTELKNKLAAAGVDLDAMGATSWRVSNSGGTMLQWTTQDISTLQPGDSIVIMRCRIDYPSAGQLTYTVWKTTVSLSKAGTYNIINDGIAAKNEITTNQDNKQDIEAIKAIYNANNGEAEDLK